MYKKLLFVLVFLFSVSFLAYGHSVYALTPTLTLVSNNDGDTVQVNVVGDANSSVLLNYYKSGVGIQFTSIGSTNSNGTLLTTLSSAQYGIVSNSVVHVSTAGVNGDQSNSVSWPIVSGVSNSNVISLSQTGIVLSVGQSNSITASNLNGGSLFLSSNSSPVIANVAISGSQITVTGNSYGSTTATLCLVSNTSNCVSAYITVQNSGAQALTFSQSSVSLSAGQSIVVTISGGSGSYTVKNNSSQSPNFITTNLSGSTLTLTTTGTTGTSSITICTADMNSCGIINVTIGGYVSTTAITFSQSSPTVVVGQSQSVSVYGPTGAIFYVSSNSNPNYVQANLSGSTLSLVGIANGSSTITICSSSTNCGSITVVVNYNYTNNGVLTLSQSSATLSIGQSLNITISGGTMPYTINSNYSNIFQSSLNSNILTLIGITPGTGLMNVCSTAGSGLTLSVTVTGGNVTLPTGCTSAYGFSPSSGVPCTPSNKTSTPVVSTPAPTTSSTTYVSAKYKFTKPLKLGSTGDEVIELQRKLTDLGFYTGPINGKYGPLTEKTVKEFQKEHGLSQLGNVGPGTRAILNK